MHPDICPTCPPYQNGGKDIFSLLILVILEVGEIVDVPRNHIVRGIKLAFLFHLGNIYIIDHNAA